MRQHSLFYYSAISVVLFFVLALFLCFNALNLESALEIESERLKKESLELSVTHATIDKPLKNNAQ